MLIETGRINNIPKEERTCGHCDELEDEEHVLFKCPAYDEWRTTATNLLCPELDGDRQNLVDAIRRAVNDQRPDDDEARQRIICVSNYFRKMLKVTRDKAAGRLILY